jgi:hypothetical protein
VGDDFDIGVAYLLMALGALLVGMMFFAYWTS